MKLWDFAAIDDHELLKLQLEEYDVECFNGHLVLLPHGFDEELSIFSGARHVCRLKMPFAKSSQRLFVAILHRYFSSRESSFPGYQIIEIDGCGHLEPGAEVLLSSICNFLQWSESESSVDGNNALCALDLSSLEELGEIGYLFKGVFRRTSYVARSFSTYFMSEELVTSGTLRSLGVASAIAEKWRLVLRRSGGDVSFISEGGKRFLLRIERMLKSCCVGEGQKKINSQSRDWPMLLAATAGWLMRVGLINRTLDNNSSSVLCVVRSFELMLQANALTCGAGEFSAHDGEFYICRRKVSGCGVFLDLIDDRTIKSKLLLSEKEGWVIRARTVLSVRNHSKLAHGILDVDQIGFDDFFVEVRSLIKEFSDDMLVAELEQAFTDLRPPPIKKLVREEIQRFLLGYIV